MAILAAGLAAGALLAPAVVAAQTGSSGSGFLFGQPELSLAIRGGFVRPSASSDIFTFTSQELTVGKSDFSGASFSADFGVRVNDRFAIVLGSGYSARTIPSESRGFIGTDDLPITQQTDFRRVPLTLGLRYNFVPSGRSLGALAWIPAKWTPYAGVGGGVMHYSFRQAGEFVDYKTLDIFRSRLESRGYAAQGYANAGVDYSLSARVALQTEARYDYAKATMGGDFEGFDRIDLSGVSATIGFNFRF